MKLPVVAIVAAFASGIALGEQAVSPYLWSRAFQRLDIVKQNPPSSFAPSKLSFGIIAGEANAYGHPNPGLLERLEASGVQVLRTDRDGAVHVLTDGQQLEVSCFVACPGAAKAASMLAKMPNQNQSAEKQ